MAKKTQLFKIDLKDTENWGDVVEKFCDKKLDEKLTLAASFTLETDLVLIFQPIDEAG